MEVAFDQADAECISKIAESLRVLNERFDEAIMFGAGTAVSKEQVKAAADRGVKYIFLQIPAQR